MSRSATALDALDVIDDGHGHRVIDEDSRDFQSSECCEDEEGETE